jgi:hypothetical protein
MSPGGYFSNTSAAPLTLNLSRRGLQSENTESDLVAVGIVVANAVLNWFNYRSDRQGPRQPPDSYRNQPLLIEPIRGIWRAVETDGPLFGD